MVASVLTGSWRLHPPPFQLGDDDLKVVVPVLLEMNLGALGWWRLRATHADHPLAQPLRDAFRLGCIHALAANQALARLATAFQEANIEYALAKGWVVARLYADEGLRPYGDFDAAVHKSDVKQAEEVASIAVARWFDVDLQPGFHGLIDRSNLELLSQAQVVSSPGASVHVLRPEHHLRLLCQHLLHHGAGNPKWLVDVAAALEATADDFDWDECLAGDRRRTQYVRCAVTLAERVLDADMSRVPAQARLGVLPKWVEPSVLTAWRRTRDIGYFHGLKPTILSRLRHPSTLGTALRQRWLNPIEATYKLGAGIDNFPRFPIQLAEFELRAALWAPRHFLLHRFLRTDGEGD